MDEQVREPGRGYSLPPRNSRPRGGFTEKDVEEAHVDGVNERLLGARDNRIADLMRVLGNIREILDQDLEEYDQVTMIREIVDAELD